MLSLLYLLAETDILLRLSEQNSFRQLGVSGLARCLCACVSVCMCQKRKRTRASEKKGEKVWNIRRSCSSESLFYLSVSLLIAYLRVSLLSFIQSDESE